MKMTKSVMISAVILAGILFTGCPGGAGENGGTSGKTKDVIKIIDGKSSEVNYTNNTNETQKFRVYVNSPFPEKAEGRFYLYDQPTNSPYEFGVFLDYKRGTTIDNYEWNDFNLIKLNVNNKQDGHTNYKVYLGRFSSDISAEQFDNYFEGFNFTKVTDYKEFSFIIDSDNGKDYDDSNKFTFEPRDGIKRQIGYDISILVGEGRTNNSKFGYYLILPPGSTCHLKFIITETN